MKNCRIPRKPKLKKCECTPDNPVPPRSCSYILRYENALTRFVFVCLPACIATG